MFRRVCLADKGVLPRQRFNIPQKEQVMLRANLFLLALAPSALVGCAQYIYAEKPGASQADFSRDLLECKALSQRLTGKLDDKVTVTNCMESKEWENIRYERRERR